MPLLRALLSSSATPPARWQQGGVREGEEEGEEGEEKEKGRHGCAISQISKSECTLSRTCERANTSC